MITRNKRRRFGDHSAYVPQPQKTQQCTLFLSFGWIRIERPHDGVVGNGMSRHARCYLGGPDRETTETGATGSRGVWGLHRPVHGLDVLREGIWDLVRS